VTTIRVAERRRFTQIDRETVNDSRLGFRARGVLTWLLDKTDDWRTNSDAIAHAGKEGRDAVRRALNELEEHGYLVREKVRTDDGQWVSVATCTNRARNPWSHQRLKNRRRETSGRFSGRRETRRLLFILRQILISD
jgi:hypothetical protein